MGARSLHVSEPAVGEGQLVVDDGRPGLQLEGLLEVTDRLLWSVEGKRRPAEPAEGCGLGRAELAGELESSIGLLVFAESEEELGQT